MTQTSATEKSPVVIRPLEARDEDHWRKLWTGYLTYYETSVSDAVYATTFARLLSGATGEFRGLIAEVDGVPVGLTHYLFHRHCWKVENVCYLQDLYTDPALRGQGVARTLIEAVYSAADAEGMAACRREAAQGFAKSTAFENLQIPQGLLAAGHDHGIGLAQLLAGRYPAHLHRGLRLERIEVGEVAERGQLQHRNLELGAAFAPPAL